MNRSAGILLFRRRPAGLEVLLAHPGGPFWRHRDLGAWTLPKGEIESGEEALAAARREFEEETGLTLDGPFLPLDEVKQKAGKRVVAWACEGDCDANAITGNTVTMEWPRGSGRLVEFPEVDRCAWFGLDAARDRINAAQAAFLDRLQTAIL